MCTELFLAFLYLGCLLFLSFFLSKGIQKTFFRLRFFQKCQKIHKKNQDFSFQSLSFFLLQEKIRWQESRKIQEFFQIANGFGKSSDILMLGNFSKFFQKQTLIRFPRSFSYYIQLYRYQYSGQNEAF
jgi:hypothetical protein